ncbi:hypothetical protein E2C01_065261 [Portunus trituberculatus]|uniref:Uncharacterized protein n=1 Tax=Portunus trituberculatus TaxID=210409 RepID=A0A5B7HR75_PORTR|nr:hypothetical protein [Portunus trituberculatus]
MLNEAASFMWPRGARSVSPPSVCMTCKCSMKSGFGQNRAPSLRPTGTHTLARPQFVFGIILTPEKRPCLFGSLQLVLVCSVVRSNPHRKG